jgi:DNA-directed RNA polymerase subunit RPC12/RpoP
MSQLPRQPQRADAVKLKWDARGAVQVVRRCRCAGGASIVESCPMTLRQYLADAKYQTWYCLLSVCYVIAVGAAIYTLAPIIGGTLVAVLGVPSLMLMFLFGPQLFRLVRCPRCSARLGALGYWAVMTNAQGEGGRFRQVRPIAFKQIERLGKCPNCGLRLDEEIGAAPT